MEKKVTDLEITKACAEAMGFKSYVYPYGTTLDGIVMPTTGPCLLWLYSETDYKCQIYHPLVDDAQMAAMIKKFPLWISRGPDGKFWVTLEQRHFIDPDLNRAVCQCVANMTERVPA